MNFTTVAIFGICFIFLMTCLGASIIFLFKREIGQKYKVFFLSFAGGIMLASSFFSLLVPSISSAENFGNLAFLPCAVGFLLGCIFMFVLDIILNKSQNNDSKCTTHFTRNQKMFVAISLHNIPEGLSVGLAIGSSFLAGSSISFITALSLAIGIGIQNIPEGLAVSLPIFEESGKKGKAFLYGVFSGILEPLAAILGLFLSSIFSVLLPWFLAFAGGTMIYTIVNELLPETKSDSASSKGTWFFIAGFLIMMILDVAFS